MKVYAFISDLQVPYEDKRAVEAVASWIDEVKPDMVASVGDEIDLPSISRWEKGLEGEWSRRIGKDRDRTVEVLGMLQVQHVIRSNHTDRLLKSLRTRLPGLLGLPELELPNFLRFPELGVTYHEKPWPFHKDWLLMHGDEKGVRAQAGGTAAGLSAKTGQSVVCGHSHRLGLIPTTESWNGKVHKIRWGFETGNLMDLKQAGYTGGIASWQQGFGIILVDGATTIPIPVPIVNRRFNALGVERKW